MFNKTNNPSLVFSAREEKRREEKRVISFSYNYKYSLPALLLLTTISSNLFAIDSTFRPPMDSKTLGKSFGGTKNDIDVYQDGNGVLVVCPTGKGCIDNKDINNAIISLGEDAKKSNQSVFEKLTAEKDGDIAKLSLYNKFKSIKDGFVPANSIVEGGACDDNNPSTTGDKYVNGICVGTSAPQGKFYLDTNGVTIVCDKAIDGETGIINGKIYTAVNNTTIRTTNDLTTVCTSHVTYFGFLIPDRKDRNTFNQDISHFDIKNAITLRDMFAGAESFNKPIGDWNTSNVRDMNNMFQNASSFNQPIGNWNTSNVIEMNEMFRGATAFNQPIGNWDINLVIFWMDFHFSSPLTQANCPTKLW